jgi:ABC-type polysaccharide/polyol phosphate transport system ATPase subunit
MSDAPAIQVRGLSKKYRLFASPAERLKEALHPFRKRYHREFWALRDIDLTVEPGQTMGIIGRNGSGKSTLLQIICGVLQPTAGQVQVNGRVSALLELGAGFNPDFTGRENVYLNGAIMGYTREEMRDRMPLIEEFAGIGEFIDQPVKTYSSGMFVRLAFAAAINVDPDILVVDEALAVGDVSFQHKCYEQLHSLRDDGVTILFVTHDTRLVTQHCEMALLLSEGRMVATGNPDDVVHTYLDTLRISEARTVSSEAMSGDCEEIDRGKLDAPRIVTDFVKQEVRGDHCPGRLGYNPNEKIHGRRAEVMDFLLLRDNETPTSVFEYGGHCDVYVKVRLLGRFPDASVGMLITSVDNLPVFGTNTTMLGRRMGLAEGCVYTVRLGFDVTLNSGDYFMNVGVGMFAAGEFENLVVRRNLVHFSVSGAPGFTGHVAIPTVVDVVQA